MRKLRNEIHRLSLPQEIVDNISVFISTSPPERGLAKLQGILNAFKQPCEHEEAGGGEGATSGGKEPSGPCARHHGCMNDLMGLLEVLQSGSTRIKKLNEVHKVLRFQSRVTSLLMMSALDLGGKLRPPDAFLSWCH